VLAATNTQVASRVSPRLVDPVVAVAPVREDISDTLLVVAITTEPRDVLARVTGSPPAPDTTTLGSAPDSGGYGTTHVRVGLSPSRTVDLPGA